MIIENWKRHLTNIKKKKNRFQESAKWRLGLAGSFFMTFANSFALGIYQIAVKITFRNFVMVSAIWKAKNEAILCEGCFAVNGEGAHLQNTKQYFVKYFPFMRYSRADRHVECP